MNQSSLNALHYLTGHANMDEVSVEELQKLVEENPYFPVTRFLLAKKLKGENHPDFLSQVQKTALYYSNPHWLNFQLEHEPTVEIVTRKITGLTEETAQEGLPKDQAPNNEKISYSTPSIAATNAPEEKVDEETQIIAEEHPVTTVFTHDELEAAANLAHEILHEGEENSSLPVETESQPVANVHQERINRPEEGISTINRDTNEEASAVLEQPVNTGEPLIRDNFEQVVLDALTPAAVQETIAVSEEMAGVTTASDDTTEAFLNEAETLKSTGNETSISEGLLDSERLIEPAKVPAKESVKETDLTVVPREKPANLEEPKTINEETSELDEHEKMFQNIKAMLDATSEEAGADVANRSVPIDPYYTIDYFASQGIKLDLEKNPQDQLGKNLKKFTQWLKHMKKLGPEDATEAIIKKETETDIVRIADSSNTVREVVTEAMASVLEKQGKKDKAIELYNKLSFLNRDKSAYFAHKIKNLKGI
jgi:hypothetical protein